MSKDNDLRVIKTKRVLFETLTDLMKENSFENIKTSDICSKALINRSTFYSHYNDKYDLLVDFINELKNELMVGLAKNEQEINSKKYFMEAIKLLVEHIDKKKDIYSAILVNNQNGVLMDIILDVVNKDVNERIKNSKELASKKVPTDIITKFYLGAIANIGIEWIRGKYSKDSIIEYLDILIPNKIN